MLRSSHQRLGGIITNASVRYNIGSASRALSIAPSNSNLHSSMMTQKGCTNNDNVHLAAGTIHHTRSFHKSSLYQKAAGDDDVYVTKTEQSTSSKNNNNAPSSNDDDSSTTSGSTCSQGIPNDIDDDDEEEQEEMFVMADPVLGLGTIKEWGGPRRGGTHAEPTRFGDWERRGRCTDF